MFRLPRSACAVRALLCTALVLPGFGASLHAQARGRWAILLSGGVRGLTRGELRIGPGSGTLWLETDSAPRALRDVQLAGDTIVRFVRPDGTRLAFTGLIHGDVLRGTARADSGPTRIWTATRLQEEAEYYPVLPQFTLRQIVIGRRDSTERIPGAWVSAARAMPDSFEARYAALAHASGIAALSGRALTNEGPLRVLGLARREEIVAASIATLQRMRAQVPDGATRARFDRIFRPRGDWLVDLHDAALALARAGSPGLTLESAVPALRAVGWLPADSAAALASVRTALYRLSGLQQHDSAQVGDLIDAMHRMSPASAQSVDLLLGAYRAAAEWDAGAVQFLLTAPWIGGSGPPSVAGRMRALWGDSLPMPVVVPHYFGYAQAVPRYGVPGPLFARIVTADNLSATRWLERHHEAALLAALRLLPAEFTPDAELVTAGETIRLTTVEQESGARDNGFLEPQDAIAVDPGYMPLLAFAAAVHEWQHLAFERLRREAAAGTDTAGTIALRGADTYVAEGLAEWRTARLLNPLAASLPLLYVGEAEKHVRLARDPSEPHVLGMRLVGALANALPDDAARLALLLAAAEDPTAIVRHPVVHDAWRRLAGSPDLTYRGGGRRALVPGMTFTLEDQFPDLVSMRVDAAAVGR